MQTTTIIAYFTYHIGKCFFLSLSISRAGRSGQPSHKDDRMKIDKTSPEGSLDMCGGL